MDWKHLNKIYIWFFENTPHHSYVHYSINIPQFDFYATDNNVCGATLITLQYAVCALHCVDMFAANNFEASKETYGFPSSTKPLDPFIVVAGAYYNRNYTPNPDSEPEYQFQVSITLYKDSFL